MKINISQISDGKEPEELQDSLPIKKEIKLIKKIDKENKDSGLLKVKLKNGEESNPKAQEKVKVDVKGKKDDNPKSISIKKIVKEDDLGNSKSIETAVIEKEEPILKEIEKPNDEVIIIGKNSPTKQVMGTEPKEDKKLKSGLILIAEDEKPLSRALEIKLTKEGYEVLVASNGEDAIRFLDKKKFDLIILDLVMPKKDGFAVLEHFKEENMKSNVIVLSNLAQEEDFKRAKDMGAMTYFIKSNTPIIELVKYIKENI
ncbi:MAG: response regulator [Candidatus Pacebacteria bacterium]|nr:response regulator [Candidatus Paceibacterota bacterium]